MARFTKAVKEEAIRNAHRYGVPPSILLGVWKVESGFDPLALGDLNADNAAYSYGIGQLHVKGAGHGFHPRKLLNLAFNANLSAKYLGSGVKMFPGKIRLAISGYNQGMGGAKEKGEAVNKGYVDAVIDAAKGFEELDAIKPDKAEARRYIVKGNDSLWKIAQRFYDDGREWERIYTANAKVIGPDPDLIHPGQELIIP